jgi:signal recognition particle subunit SRP54
VGLVEKVASSFSQEEAQKAAERLQKGQFDLNDLATQLQQINKMGGIGSLLSMLPGFDKMQDKLGKSGFSEDKIKHQLALIRSMTPQERRDCRILNASRKRRIVAGSGASIQELNRLLKQFQDMATLMKRFSKGGEKGILRQGLASLFNRR